MKLLLSQLSSDDSGSNSPVVELGKTTDHALPMLSFSCIVASTNNFSVANKLGEGGYGPVYKLFFYFVLLSYLRHIYQDFVVFLLG